MAKCNDCIHFSVCKYTSYDHEDDDSLCPDFSDLDNGWDVVQKLKRTIEMELNNHKCIDKTDNAFMYALLWCTELIEDYMERYEIEVNND